MTIENFNFSFAVAPFLVPLIGTSFSSFLIRAFAGSLLLKIVGFFIELLKKPIWILSLIFLLTYCPNVVQWIFLQIGLIEFKVYAILLSILMPSIFGETSELTDWADIFNAGINALPQEMVEIMASLGIAELMGIITSALTSGFVIKIYYRIMHRAGLM